MRTHTILLYCSFTALVLAQSANAEIYKTVDKKGRVVYTDQPPANADAKIVELPTINSLPPTQFTPDTSPTPNTGVADVNYQISIVNPTSGVTLQADERSVKVSVSLDQTLHPGHALAYFLDGKMLEKTTSTDFVLTEPPRGEHQLHVESINEKGKSMGRSNAVTIIVMRPLVHQKSVKVPGKN